MKMPAKRHLFVMLFGLLCVVGLIFLDSRGYFTPIDARLTDKLIVPRPASSDIVIVAIDDKSIQALGVWPWPRSLHARMIDELTEADVKVIGYDVTFSEASDPQQDQILADAIASSDHRILLSQEHNLLPLQIFYDNANEQVFFAYTNLSTDRDGVVRITQTYIDGPDAASFGQAVAGRIGPEFLRVPFVGPPGSFVTVSFSDVLDGTVPSSFFREKTVLVGATAPDLHDTLLTPIGNMSGVEAHANIIQALREGRSLTTLTSNERIILLLVLAALILVLSLILRLRYLVFSILGIFVAYLMLMVGASVADLLLPVTAPILLIVLFGVVDLTSRYLAEQGRRRFIHNAFAHYLAPQVIDKLVRGETALELGGSKRELTILFSDIRGFTSLSEKLPPEKLVPFLNEYLTAMTDLVLDSEGVVDKYIGDAIMAFWGAPIKQEDHAVRSAMTAIKMKRQLTELQANWSKTDQPSIDIGIGLNTGEVIVGNMGSRQRFDYTVIGDDVNLASRLEGLTKQYGVTAIISEATNNKLGDAFVTRELDLVAVKGRTQPVRIFELVEESGRVDKPTTRLINQFEQALELYRAQRWDEALAMFESLANTDKPSAVYLERINYFKEYSPNVNWNGAFIAKEK